MLQLGADVDHSYSLVNEEYDVSDPTNSLYVLAACFVYWAAF